MTPAAPPEVTPEVTPALLEAAGVRAWPATTSRTLGPWVLRASQGFTNRANAIAVLHLPPDDEIPVLVAEAERFAAHHGITPRFQVPSSPRPRRVTRYLEARGYRRTAPPSSDVAVMTAEVGAALHALPIGGDVKLRPSPDPDWFSTWWDGFGRPDRLRPQAHALLDRVPEIRRFASVRGDRSLPASSVGLSVTDGHLVGIFAMTTAIDHRGRGLAARVLGALLARAATDGATTAYLQVPTDAAHAEARRLYERAGFTTSHTYAYWAR